MKRHMIHSFLLVVSVLLLAACGTDNKENPPEADGPYSFFDATTPLTITKPSEDANGTVTGGDYNISVVLREFELPSFGEVVTMKPFSSAYGFLENSYVDTDLNGRAIFAYTAPTGKDFDAVRGQDVTIQAVYADSNVIETASTDPVAPDILLTQDFILQFR